MMSILEAALWVQSTPFFTELRLSSYVYPAVLSGHVAGIALGGGMILASDLRLLGIALRKRPAAEVIEQLRISKRIAFLLVATCGVLMLGSKAEEYYFNVFFRIKLQLLALVAVHAVVFRRGVYGRSAGLDLTPRMPAQAKLAASLSLLLWLGLVIAGRGIGYVEVPPGIHARTQKCGADPLVRAGRLGPAEAQAGRGAGCGPPGPPHILAVSYNHETCRATLQGKRDQPKC